MRSQCTPELARSTCDTNPDDPPCVFGRLHESRVGDDQLAALLDTPTSDRDEALRALLPMIGDKPLVEDTLGPGQTITWQYASFPPYTMTLPADWEDDPNGQRTWRWWYQSLGWLYLLYDRDVEGVDTSVAVAADYVENALYRDPPLEWTFGDHSLGMRLERVANAFARYVEAHDALDRRIVDAVAQLMLIHVYAIASDACYSPGHNHGLMQDLALLRHLPDLRGLREYESLYEMAATRFEAQVRFAVTDEGVHVENSPHYHLVFAQLLTGAIDAFREAGKTPPSYVIEARDALLDALVYMLQPDNSVPQFGDSPNDTKRPELLAVVEQARAQPESDPAVLDRLDWILWNGDLGAPPPTFDRVFEQSGYSAFHSETEEVTGHLTCGRLSRTHYQQDESSIEIFAFDRTLITDTGLYGYSDEPFTLHQRQPSAHNILVVDDATLDPHGTPSIVAHELTPEASWVQCQHRNYRELGVPWVTRTFVHFEPSTFVVVDHAGSDDDTHDYTQHFHLHPSLTVVEQLDEHTWAARTRDGTGPSLLLWLAELPTEVTQARGEEEPVIRGWHFPNAFTAEPATDLAFHYRRGPGGVDFPVAITVVPAGVPEAVAAQVSYRQVGDEATITVGGDRTVTVPER